MGDRAGRRIQLTGSYFRVTEKSLPELWEILVTARDRLSLPITPEFYIRSASEINAETSGASQPVLVVNSGTVDALDRDELLFVIAHELGHIKSGHVLYYQIASMIPRLASTLGQMTLGVGEWLGAGVQIALLHWQRTSELTADRAGLLACQDKKVAVRTMMKLAGLPQSLKGRVDVSQFIRQAEEFQDFDNSLMNRAVKIMSGYTADHPWTVMRAKELMRWIETGGYNRVLAMMPFVGAPRLQAHRVCASCGTEALATNQFCRRCGKPLGPGTAALPV